LNVLGDFLQENSTEEEEGDEELQAQADALRDMLGDFLLDSVEDDGCDQNVFHVNSGELSRVAGEGKWEAEIKYCRNTAEEGFECKQSGVDAEGNPFETDCTGNFLDRNFWADAREEKFWQEHMYDLYDFYEFWELYHEYSQDETTCDLVRLEEDCDVFEMTRKDKCEIKMEYCADEEYMACHIYGVDEEGNRYSKECVDDFLDFGFWE
jgi:hypothetical protein